MAVPRQFADARSLRRVASAVFGTSRRLAYVRRLPGGSKKGSYRITMDDGATALVYVWNPAEDYWQGVLPDEASDPAGPFSHASGLDLFEAAAGRLATAGVRCPRLLLADRSRDLYPGDIAVVEHVPGGSLETLLEDNPAAAQRPLAVLAGWLASMESCQSALFGKVVVADAGQPSRGASCPQVILDRALRDLSEVRARDPRAARDGDRLEDLLHALDGPLEPRPSCGLVHGELGPDHILLDRHGDPVLIDIEGLMYFDAEWEHAFLRMRFGEHYPRLTRPDLDPGRLRFYRLALHLNLVAGPLRIADTGHPERNWFLSVAEYHLRRALTFPARLTADLDRLEDGHAAAHHLVEQWQEGLDTFLLVHDHDHHRHVVTQAPASAPRVIGRAESLHAAECAGPGQPGLVGAVHDLRVQRAMPVMVGLADEDGQPAGDAPGPLVQQSRPGLGAVHRGTGAHRRPPSPGPRPG